ncbi:MAG: recombinase family protein [Stigonema ocellatum SAG 48.90 = DSM 106950]|nr:recombinase family protein [Stigonema ocellatum SAG 48.90 = DSM 106950]
MLPVSCHQAQSQAEFDPENQLQNKTKNKVAIYTRVSSAENRNNLDTQAERLCQYSSAKGYQIIHVVKEVGSGLNDHRKKLEKLLKMDDYDILIVEHKRRPLPFWNQLHGSSFVA